MPRTVEPDGDYHHHFLPFYDVSVAREGEDRHLAIFPLLYFGRRSPGTFYDHVLPIFSRWRVGPSSHVLSWPLLHVAHDPWDTPYYFIPTLLRLGFRDAGSDQRLGVPFIFSLFEHAEDTSSRLWAFGNFFNFAETAESGLPIGYLAAEEGEVRSHLFPLYAAKRAKRSWYAHTPLLGLWQNAGPKGEEPVGVVVPPLFFFRYRSDPEHVTVGQLPTFLYSTGKDDDLLFILPIYFSNRQYSPPRSRTFYSFLYGRTEEENTDSESHLFPLLLSPRAAARGDESSTSCGRSGITRVTSTGTACAPCLSSTAGCGGRRGSSGSAVSSSVGTPIRSAASGAPGRRCRSSTGRRRPRGFSPGRSRPSITSAGGETSRAAAELQRRSHGGTALQRPQVPVPERCRGRRQDATGLLRPGVEKRGAVNACARSHQ